LSTSSAVGRIAALLALIGAFVVLLLLFLGGDKPYKITAEFENAGQLVKGNNVDVAGVPAGTVTGIQLGDDGQAQIEMEIKDPYKPLAEGTTATIRSQSLSGIANRYIELQMPEGDETGAPMKSGSVIDQSRTVSEVDLDELFNTLDEKTVGGLKHLISGFARSYDGVGPQTNKGFHYLNPFLSTSRRVFGEINSDQTTFENLVIDTASLTSKLAERSDDIDRLVDGGAKTFGAIGRQNENLAEAVGRLPDFMRQFNTTAFNLRSALNDVTPLVDASKPAVKKLIPFTRNLRGFARDAVPAITDLDAIINKPGANNDLIELTRLQDPLGQIATGPVVRNGQTREGAEQASARALGDSLDQISFFRPYITIEGVSGWFDDFGHSGVYDANGGMGRIGTTFNAFSPSAPGIPNLTPAGVLSPGQVIDALDIDNLAKCPGSNERGLTDDQLTYGGTIDCDPAQVPLGP
jgi:phospholipid/cholesterol/gamma-HCH transport system substrate-binding protein